VRRSLYQSISFFGTWSPPEVANNKYSRISIKGASYERLFKASWQWIRTSALSARHTSMQCIYESNRFVGRHSSWTCRISESTTDVIQQSIKRSPGKSGSQWNSQLSQREFDGVPGGTSAKTVISNRHQRISSSVFTATRTTGINSTSFPMHHRIADHGPSRTHLLAVPSTLGSTAHHLRAT
jgi:hypothetical protein